ncbi:NRDE family protein [Aureisphaera galaxeae]|uniref:NRDE family protein n=1 Tax=Aureisphaera galaxeae TaxID=1538023 RepID=UPI0023508542|nr:NRDE family protein [Aureisphaera galaxeae]MDC8003259.1 NRDE family protein [Aureisphaera galaxeae]
MCTLTFYPTTDSGFILTSSRDEAPQRKTLLPEEYDVEGSKLIFPKDAVAGGTWLGVSDRQRLVCLLNGGFEPHIRKESYRMSRGIIVTSLLTAVNAVAEVHHFDFTGIEPFTVVIVDWTETLKIHELVWDGANSHFSEKSLQPHIWSSSLLYPKDVKRKRQVWFSDLLKDDLAMDGNALLNFHKTAGDGNPHSDLVMDMGFVKTKSISQIEKNADLGTFVYEDLQTKESKKLKF